MHNVLNNLEIWALESQISTGGRFTKDHTAPDVVTVSIWGFCAMLRQVFHHPFNLFSRRMSAPRAGLRPARPPRGMRPAAPSCPAAAWTEPNPGGLQAARWTRKLGAALRFLESYRALAAALALAAAAPWACAANPSAAAPALHGLPNYPVPAAQRAQAELTAQTGVPVSELAPNAPSKYTVKRGDTLWAISGMYLRKPWDWPKLWGMNLQQIRNPHWIFPGQVLYLDISNGRARLGMGSGSQGIPTVKLNPQVESSPLPPEGIPTISPELIAPFLTQPLIVEPDTLEASPRIVALPKGYTMASPGTQVYVRGDVSKATRYQIYRPARPLVDPATKKIIAYQAEYLGTTHLVEPPSGPDAVSVFRVDGIEREVGVGDRLVIAPPREFLNYTPHAPAKPISGDIVSIYGDLSMAAKNSVVALNRGADDGLERGDVLALWHNSRMVKDSTAPGKPEIELPDRQVGVMMVFRTFKHVAYALILSADEPVEVADRFTQP